MDIVLSSGTYLYKGFGNPKIGCHSILNSTDNFFVTQNTQTARKYGSLCRFVTKRNIRLFVLNHTNIKKIFHLLPPDTATGLQFALGTGVKRGQQVSVFQKLVTPTLPVGFKNRPHAPGERLSVLNINRDVFQRFSSDFLIKAGYDGFYSPFKTTGFHQGWFPSEIMLCKAGRILKKNDEKGLPVLDQKKITDSIPYLFILYSRKVRRLIHPYRQFIIYLTGGMGTKLYLEARAARASREIIKTRDFDFTFAVPHHLKSLQVIRNSAASMSKIMTNHCSGFVHFLNKNYTGANIKLLIKNGPLSRNRVQIPSTGRRVYQIYSYQLQIGNSKPIDLADAALTHVPNVTREHIQLKYSRGYGIPIQRLKFLYKDTVSVLTGSFVYKGIKSRNPLIGVKKQKGIRDTNRIKYLRKLIPSKTVYNRLLRKTNNFIQKINAKKFKNASDRAHSVIKNLHLIK